MPSLWWSKESIQNHSVAGEPLPGDQSAYG